MKPPEDRPPGREDAEGAGNGRPDDPTDEDPAPPPADEGGDPPCWEHLLGDGSEYPTDRPSLP